MIRFRGHVVTETAQTERISQIMMIYVGDGKKMTEEQRKKLKIAQMNEFLSDDEEVMRKGMRNIGQLIATAQEEAGLSRFEAIHFVATMLGNSLRQG